MKKSAFVFLSQLIFMVGFGQSVKIQGLPLPDSVKTVAIISTLSPQIHPLEKKASVGIQTDAATLLFTLDHKTKGIQFSVPAATSIVSRGIQVKQKSNTILFWPFAWESNMPYKFHIATAGDSAQNFVVYSGYVYFPNTNQWKLIGSFKIQGSWAGIKNPAYYFKTNRSGYTEQLFSTTWSQRNNGAWKKLSSDASSTPILTPFSDMDSALQAGADQAIIKSAIEKGETDATQFKDGLFYKIMKRSGNETLINNTDTVSVYYKGYLFGTNQIFDETSTETRSFPLGRLIRGWSIGLSGTHVGDKIKLVIPSGLGYSIRTRSPKIPPNSILVFEIETVSSKPKRDL